jgi:hypothetical protein
MSHVIHLMRWNAVVLHLFRDCGLHLFDARVEGIIVLSIEHGYAGGIDYHTVLTNHQIYFLRDLELCPWRRLISRE